MKKYWKVLATLLAISCAGYVKPDIEPQYVRDAEACLKTGPCTLLQISSDNYHDARIYVNGAQFGWATGLSHTTTFIPNSRLTDGNRCATITVRLIGPGDVWQSAKECLHPKGGHFGLLIGSLFSTTSLTPWAR